MHLGHLTAEQTTLSLDAWLTHIETLHPNKIDLGLQRIRDVYAHLTPLPNTVPVITVAGTNGKGSTVRTLEALAMASGLRVGAYTSPHILRYNERIQINQQPVDDAVIVAAFEHIDRVRGSIPLTYFEYGTLAALAIFAESNLDLVVLEVGLGGRLDAVNMVDPTVAVITNIDLDHQNWLGDTREKIGAEKAGIVREGGLLVCGDEDPPESVTRHKETCRQSWWYGADFTASSVSDGESITLDLNQQKFVLAEPLALLPQNIAIGCQAFCAAGFSLTPIIVAQAVPLMQLTGRHQHWQEQPLLVVDVGHNPQAGRALAKHLARELDKRHASGRLQGVVKGSVHCVVGMLADKDVINALKPLFALVDTWHCSELAAGDRALPAAELYGLLERSGVTTNPALMSPARHVDALLKQVKPQDVVVVFGSFYTVADVVSWLNAEGVG